MQITTSQVLRTGVLAVSLGFSCLEAWAQGTLTGRILDAQRQALPNANVRLIEPKSKTIIAGMVTDAKGNYTISKIPKGTFRLEVSFIGFATYTQELKFTEEKAQTRKLEDISLKEDNTLLKELVVAAKATEVVLKGDTIEYNADSFKTTQGAVLEELIKKLPGAEISDTGEITINGKSITQIMIDGKRFFESDPKVAIKNLPAELVQKVQVLDKQSDMARMTGFADGEDETIINLTIKPGRKKGLFGTLYAGAGTEKRYELGGILNRFKDNQQWTILGGLNNTNNSGASDIASDISQSDIARVASGGGRSRPGQRSTANDGITISRLLGGNAIFSITPQLEFGGNIFSSNSDKTLQTSGATTNLRTSGNTLDTDKVTELNKKYNYGTTLRLEWKPDQRTEIIITPQLSLGIGKGTYSSTSKTTLEANNSTISSSDLLQHTDSRTYNLRMDANISRKLNDKGRTLTLSLEGRLGGTDTDGDYLSNIYTASNASTTTIDQRLGTDNSSKIFRTRLNYVEPIAKGLLLQFNYQLRGEFSSRERSAYDRDAGGAYSLFNQLYSNAFESTYIAHKVGVAFKRATAMSDLTLGVNIDPSRLKSETNSGGNIRYITRSVINYSPTLRYSYKPSKSFNLRLDYRGQSYQPTANQLAPVTDASNPLNVYKGNEELLPGFRHMLMGHLSLFSPSKQRALNLFAMGRIIQNEIVSNTFYDIATGVRTTSYTNVNGSWMFSLGGFYTTPILGKKLSFRLSTRNSLNNQVGFVDGMRNNSLSLGLSQTLALAYRKDWLDTSLKGSWSMNKVNNCLLKSLERTTQDYGLGWDAVLTLPLGLSLESNLNWTTQRGYGEGFNQTQTLWDLSLGYSFLKNKVATIRAKAYDLLGQKRNVYQNISSSAISTQETNTLGQYVMLHFIYKFNSFSGNASAQDMKTNSPRGMGGPPPGRF